MRVVPVSLCILLFATSHTWAQSPAIQPVAGADAVKPYVLTPLGVRELKETKFIYHSMETTLSDIGAAATKPMADLERAVVDVGIAPTGSAIFSYKGATPDPTAKFTLQIGLPVGDDATAPDGYELRTIEKQQAFVALYTGPLSQLTPAYMEIFEQLFAAGHSPSDMLNERYIYWEGEESPNNVILIEAVLASQ